MGVGQKSRSDRDWKERNPPNRGRRGLGWVQSFEERRLRVTKNPFLVTLTSWYFHKRYSGQIVSRNRKLL